MAAIKKLLNPAPEVSGSDSEFEHVSTAQQITRVNTVPIQSRKKQKLCKDAAVFTRAKTRGECRYPPHEFQDEMLSAQHQQFEIFPMGKISEYPRHIPYQSEKKEFLRKTGRDSFEVFQYCFKIPGVDATYTMLWDYNIGLVRTTPLFKCTGHSKTTPAKMLACNVGLKDICHSITGGALVAQGYWMPYQAAKAIAATFCWKIRYALTPVFGVDFPDMCVPPDSDGYGQMIIDSEITRRCAMEARRYREMEESSPTGVSTTTSSPATPGTPDLLRTRVLHARSKGQAESDCSSDASNDENFGITSPVSAYGNMWTPVNTPRSTPRLPVSRSFIPSRKQIIDNFPKDNGSTHDMRPGVYEDTEKSTLSNRREKDHESRQTSAELMAASWLLNFKLNATSSSQSRKRRASA